MKHPIGFFFTYVLKIYIEIWVRKTLRLSITEPFEENPTVTDGLSLVHQFICYWSYKSLCQIYSVHLTGCSLHTKTKSASRARSHQDQWEYFEGCKPKGSYLPCVSSVGMAGRALLARYPRLALVYFCVNYDTCNQQLQRTTTIFSSYVLFWRWLL